VYRFGAAPAAAPRACAGAGDGAGSAAPAVVWSGTGAARRAGAGAVAHRSSEKVFPSDALFDFDKSVLSEGKAKLTSCAHASGDMTLEAIIATGIPIPSATQLQNDRLSMRRGRSGQGLPVSAQRRTRSRLCRRQWRERSGRRTTRRRGSGRTGA
jgi:outer membrane protein OmpA-like peptidoglycan-associated protein